MAAAFVADRLDGLSDEPWPGALRLVSDDQIDRLWSPRWSAPPRGHPLVASLHRCRDWPVEVDVGRIWRAFGLKPHLVDTFSPAAIRCSSRRVGDVVGL